MGLNLTSRFSNFFYVKFKKYYSSAKPLLENIVGSLNLLPSQTFMDLVITVVFCNCAIAIVILAVTIWIIRVRIQVVAVTKWCDRWVGDCNLLLSNAPASIAVSRSQIDFLRQIYQQQLLTIDRLRALGLFWGIARYLLTKRRGRAI